jgi:hypothetical protein
MIFPSTPNPYAEDWRDFIPKFGLYYIMDSTPRNYALDRFPNWSKNSNNCYCYCYFPPLSIVNAGRWY